MRITREYLKNTYMLDKYFYDGLTLFRFTTVNSIAKKLNKDFEFANIKVKDFEFKDYYDDDFQDYELMITLGNDEEDLFDLTIYYAVARNGERVITETSYEII